jgi:heavy-metal resistance protein
MKLRIIKVAAILVALFCLTSTEIAGQQLRRQRRQERVAKQGGNKLAPTAGGISETAPKGAAQNTQNSFEGISDSDPREFNRRFFSREERDMIIPGFGRPVVYLVVLRQLNLTEQQKESIKAISQRVGLQLRALRLQHTQLENQLEDAIYGDAFDQKRVDELSAQSGQKLAEITRMQANIEAEFRRILTPDQHYVFRYLIGQMLLPQRRVQPARPQRRIGIQ